MKQITFTYDNGTGILENRKGYLFEHFEQRFIVFKSKCLINSDIHWFIVHQETDGMFEFGSPLPESRKDAISRALVILNRLGKERTLKHIEAFANTKQLHENLEVKND